MKLTYTRKGNYLYPDLILGPEPEQLIGKYGLLRRTFLKEHREGVYWGLFFEGRLNAHLAEIDRCANERVERITAQLLQSHPAPDKATDPFGWVAHRNSLRNMAEELVLQELVYA